MRASYQTAVEWIAGNDEPAEMDAYNLSILISVQLVADVFGKTPAIVARDVLRKRDRWARPTNGDKP
jgi:hypothetical protein